MFKILLCSLMTIIAYSQNTEYSGIQVQYDEFCSRHETLKKKVHYKPDLPEKFKIASQDRFKSFKQDYQYSDLNSMSYSTLVSTLAGIKWSNVKGIFKYSEDARIFYSDWNRVKYLIDELKRRAENYTANNSLSIETFQEVIRSGFYLGFYNEGLSYLKEKQYKDQLAPAIKALKNNNNFHFGTQEQSKVIISYALLTGYYFDNEILNTAENMLQEFINNFNTNISDYYRGNALYRLGGGIVESINLAHLPTLSSPNQSPYYNKIDGLINKFDNITRRNLSSDKKWIINNTIYWSGELNRIAPVKSRQSLTAAITFHGKWNRQSVEALQQLERYFNSTDANGFKYNTEQVRTDIKARLFPNKTLFDNGNFIVNYPNNVTKSELKKLYWASKEVKAQFHRINRSESVIDPNRHGDDKLTIYIFENKNVYELNRFLNNLNTNNGGIYIENWGTFFTWQRKVPEESTLSLEELFRHEYCHYLQGRFQEPGGWGQGELYKNERLTWFEEGQAEFLAGSTQKNGIVVRLSNARSVKRDVRNLTLANLFSSKYSDGWYFYYYGSAFWNYCYENRMDIIFQMLNYVRSDNGPGLTNYLNTIASNGTIETAYQNYLSNWRTNAENFINPVAGDHYIAATNEINKSTLSSEINNRFSLNNSNTQFINSDKQKIYLVKGTYTASSNGSELNNWKNINQSLNQSITALSNQSWNGYKTATAYIDNYKNNGSNYTYDVTINGLYSNGSTIPTNIAPNAVIQAPGSGFVNQNISFLGNQSNDPDGTIVSYLWNFGDGKESTDINPNHKYTSIGNYTVRLTVTDNKGAKGNKEVSVEIKPQNGNGINETEPNNSYASSNPISLNRFFTAEISSGSDIDHASFVINQSSDIEIVFNVISGSSKLVWVLSHESNPSATIRWGSPDNPQGKFTVKQPGKYFLKMYIFGGSSSSYKLKVTTDTSSNDLAETENNNDFSNSDGPVSFSQKIIASINQNQDRDNFHFNISQAKKVTINLKILSGIKTMTWVLYHESDLNSYYAWGSADAGGSNITKTINLQNTGKYYIRVYSWTNGTANYQITFNENSASLSGPNAQTDDINMSIYPNPFNPVTTIEFSLTERQKLNIFIYNILGQKVKTIVKNKVFNSGKHYSVNWNGKNDNGIRQASGIYFIRIKGKSFIRNKRLILIK